MEIWKWGVSFFQLLFCLFSSTYGYSHIKFTSSDDSTAVEATAQYSPNESLIVSRRKRREAKVTKTCPNLPGKPTRHWSSLSGDRNFNLALVWVGKSSPTQLLLTTLEFGLIITIRAPSKLYRRKENENTFQLIQNEIHNGDIRKNFGIMKSPLNPDKVLLLSFSYAFAIKTSTVYRSVDGASTFEEIIIPFKLRSNEPLQFHPVKEDWILALDGGKSTNYGAWLSVNFGKTWSQLKTMVDSIKWGTATGSDEDRNTIFLTTKTSFSGFGYPMPSTLWRSTNLGTSFEKIVEHVHNFGVQGKFLFVSVNSKEKEKRTVHVSSNNGAIFNPINVPPIEPERFFSILDMSEGMIFLHVDEKGDTGYGTLYISDADGLSYTKSLERHFYTNDGVTDFYRVESMRGVFITHQLDTTDKTIKSLISFNRGVSWEPLHLSEEQCAGADVRPGQQCSLHYHNLYSQARGVSVQPPLSTETALGLIILHGHNGDALTGKSDVYLTNDGGYNWEKVLIGPHHYAIGDHGNLIVAVSKVQESTNKLKFSLDRGKCWHSLDFSDANITVRGLITEPGSKKRVFSLWGYESEVRESKEWTVVTVDFHNVFRRVCHQSDLESWYPHSAKNKDGCLLGLKEEYPRVKEGVFCFHGQDYKPDIKKTRCKCTPADRECNYGFEKTGDKCVRKPNIPLRVCKDGKEELIKDNDGYRLIPGDQCIGGPKDRPSYVNSGVDCPDIDRYGIIAEEKLHKTPHKKKTHKAHSVVLYVAVPVLILVVAILVIFVRKLYRNRHGGGYRFSQLKALVEEDETPTESKAFDPRPKGLRPYKDETDDMDSPMLDF